MSVSDRLEKISSLPKPLTGCSQVIMCILPIANIVIGAMHLHDCPQQPYIPIYLIVMGVFGLLIQVLSVLTLTTGKKNHFAFLSGLFFLFNFCWFIAGNVWIYSIYEPNYNTTLTPMEPYCDKTLYLFAFWTTNLMYIIFGLIFLSICCECP